MWGPDLAQRWPRRPGHLNGRLSELRRAGAEVVSNLARDCSEEHASETRRESYSGVRRVRTVYRCRLTPSMVMTPGWSLRRQAR